MRIIGIAILLIGALYWRSEWMPMLHSIGLLLVLHSMERKIRADIEAIRMRQRDSNIEEKIQVCRGQTEKIESSDSSL